jgi:hypothetical protein
MKTKIKEHSIPFSIDGINALLGNGFVSMTLTRRLMGLKWVNRNPDNWHLDGDYLVDKIYGERICIDSDYCPYGQVGERLWVTEPWCYKYDAVTAQIIDGEYWYKATNPEVVKLDDDGSHALTKAGWEASPWLAPRHMPRKASRIDLEIVSSKVQRLHDISREEIRAEGIILPMSARFMASGKFSELHKEYACWWDSLNKSRGYPFNGNWWTWVIGIRRVNNA